jgi:hypothetical protein
MVLGLTVIASLVVYLFQPEIGMVIWHVKHGSSVQLNELQFHVPAFYSAEVYSSKNVLSIISVPGRVRNCFKGSRTLKVSMISVHQQPHGELGQNLDDDNNDPWASHEYQKTKTIKRDLNLAGNPGRCIGYSGPTIWNGDRNFEIFCEFQGGLEAHFAGTEGGVNDFYKVLETAQRQKEKI